MNKALTILLLLLTLLSANDLQDLRMSEEDAEAELEKLYGSEDDTTDSKSSLLDWQNEYNSIIKFVEAVIKAPAQKVFIVYGSNSHKDGVEILEAYIRRKWEEGSNISSSSKKILKVIKDSEIDLKSISEGKSFILGSPSNNKFIKRMAKKDKIAISGNKAQFKLFGKPNCIAIAFEDSKMAVELVRVFIRSYKEFSDKNYSYFYMN